MNSNNLLSQLSYLEKILQHFSYEKLTTSDARELKDCLATFRDQLELKMKLQAIMAHKFQGTKIHSIDTAEHHKEATAAENALEKLEIKAAFSQANRFAEYLKNNPLTKAQLSYINSILTSEDITEMDDDNKQGSIMAIGSATDKHLSNYPDKTTPMKSFRKIKTNAERSTETVVNIDLIPVFQDCLGQLDLLSELIQLYKQNALEFIGQTKLHLQNLDFEGIQLAAHKLKSGLRMMQTVDLLEIVEQMENASKTDQDLKHLNFLFSCFVNEYPATERAIDIAFQKLR